MILFATGCDNNPRKYSHGQTIPDARVKIQFDEPMLYDNLFPRYVEAARLGGFPHSKGQSGSYTLDDLNSEEFNVVRNFLIWVRIENSKETYQDAVVFNIYYEERLVTTKYFEFILEKGENVSFTKDDWLLFFKYFDEILPELFPEAELSIHEHRHPAVFTDHETLLQIQAETDIEIPEKYLRIEEK